VETGTYLYFPIHLAISATTMLNWLEIRQEFFHELQGELEGIADIRVD
jgi:hypothetical protein